MSHMCAMTTVDHMTFFNVDMDKNFYDFVLLFIYIVLQTFYRIKITVCFQLKKDLRRCAMP